MSVVRASVAPVATAVIGASRGFAAGTGRQPDDRRRVRRWVSDGSISPLDLIAIGLVSAEEAAEMHAVETASAST